MNKFKLNDYVIAYDNINFIYIIGKFKNIVGTLALLENVYLTNIIPQNLNDISKLHIYKECAYYPSKYLNKLNLKEDNEKQNTTNNNLENKNFKIGDWVYFNYGEYYAIGEIDNINKDNTICFIGEVLDEIPKNKKEFDKLKKYFFPEFIEESIKIDKIHKIQFKEEIERQKIVDKLEVLKMEIDLCLDFRNKEAFYACVKEYKELEYKLNKSEVLV